LKNELYLKFIPQHTNQKHDYRSFCMKISIILFNVNTNSQKESLLLNTMFFLFEGWFFLFPVDP